MLLRADDLDDDALALQLWELLRCVETKDILPSHES